MPTEVSKPTNSFGCRQVPPQFVKASTERGQVSENKYPPINTPSNKTSVKRAIDFSRFFIKRSHQGARRNSNSLKSKSGLGTSIFISLTLPCGSRTKVTNPFGNG